MLLAAAGYFFTVSKTALLLYETSNRYQLPVYGIFLLLVMAAVYGLWNRGAVFLFYDKAGRGFSGIGKMAGIFCFVLFLAGNIYGLASGKVIFLYEEDRAVMEYAEANEHTPVVIFYNDATPYHVWWRSRELMQYDRVYFASQGNQASMPYLHALAALRLKSAIKITPAHKYSTTPFSQSASCFPAWDWLPGSCLSSPPAFHNPPHRRSLYLEGDFRKRRAGCPLFPSRPV